MTAFTVSELSQYYAGEKLRTSAVLTGIPAYTWTPTAVTGRTVRVLSCRDLSTAYDSVTASVTTGVITVDAAGTTTTSYFIEIVQS